MNTPLINNGSAKPEVLIPDDRTFAPINPYFTDDIYMSYTRHISPIDENISQNSDYEVDSETEASSSQLNDIAILQQRVFFSVYFDAVCTFLYLFLNPWLLIVVGFNLVFAYIGYKGTRHYESSYLGTYAIYSTIKLIGMSIFLFLTCIYHNAIFTLGTNEYIAFILGYIFIFCLYAYFLRNVIMLIQRMD